MAVEEDGTVVGFAMTLLIDGGLELEDLFVEPQRAPAGDSTADWSTTCSAWPRRSAWAACG